MSRGVSTPAHKSAPIRKTSWVRPKENLSQTANQHKSVEGTWGMNLNT